MSASPTTTGSILGTATAAGSLLPVITTWQAALCCCTLLLLLGILAIWLLSRKRRLQNEIPIRPQKPSKSKAKV